jgi:hypothetical protein
MQRAFGLSIPRTSDDVCDPARLALVVYDMQVGIVNQIENGQHITGRVLQVLVQPMIGRPPIMLNPVCSICDRPVKLETSKTDERGRSVHEGCYLLKIKVKRTTTMPKSLRARKSINTQNAV